MGEDGSVIPSYSMYPARIKAIFTRGGNGELSKMSTVYVRCKAKSAKLSVLSIEFHNFKRSPATVPSMAMLRTETSGKRGALARSWRRAWFIRSTFCFRAHRGERDAIRV
eukprot:scaffold388_cov380-Prasinococcus_capsulatus_cf.AAC.30